MSFLRKFRKNSVQENISATTGKFPLSCQQVGKDLQSFLDGEETNVTAEDLSAHLEACKDCGLEADVYRKIKLAISQTAEPVDKGSLDRLQDFGRKLAESGDNE